MNVGILSFSDGRYRVHKDLSPYIQECENDLSKTLQDTGEVSVFKGREIIWNPELARDEAKQLLAHDVSAVIFNVQVFAFPYLSSIAAKILEGVPILVFCTQNPGFPGLGGLQASVNMIRQTGMSCHKLWGDVSSEDTKTKIMAFLRGAYAAMTLKGQVYGLIGGRSIGMGSGAVNPDLWMNKFGVDVDHVDQLDIIRRAEEVGDDQVEKAFKWLTENIGSIKYDNQKLTEKTLREQIRQYIATKDIINEKKLDFVGVKCHYELSEYYNTQCLGAAFINDPYDWDGPKEPVVFSCEADSDGALTMQILKLVSGEPVLFMDFRFYDEKEDLLTLCNCGAMSTWYTARSDNPSENLKHVNFHPVIKKYAGNGCHVGYIAKEGPMTLGRLTREMNSYKLSVFRGECVMQPEEKLKESNPAWPHCFIKLAAPFYTIMEDYDNNHIHAIYGDYVEELRQFCTLKGIDFELFE
jgi:L-fucose isomerase